MELFLKDLDHLVHESFFSSWYQKCEFRVSYLFFFEWCSPLIIFISKYIDTFDFNVIIQGARVSTRVHNLVTLVQKEYNLSSAAMRGKNFLFEDKKDMFFCFV